MNRRQLLKLLSLGIVGHTLDIDRLLWVPGRKKIFLPTRISISQITAIELERILPHVTKLFDRDDLFWTTLNKDKRNIISSREIRVPLEVRTWNDVTRSTEEESIAFRRGLNNLLFTPQQLAEHLANVIDQSAVVRNVGISEEDRKTDLNSTNCESSFDKNRNK